MARERTNTPLQALATLNDPQFVEAARRLSEKALTQETTSFENRLQGIVMPLLSRNLTEVEVKIVQSTFDELLKYYQSNDEQAKKLIEVGESPTNEKLPAAELAAWTMTVNQLLNLDETLNK